MLPPSSRLCLQVVEFKPLRENPSSTWTITAPNVFVSPRFCSGVTLISSVWLELCGEGLC
ncbi:hypothetical protein Plhal304r1_c008g0034161 [Plasmopara halstedii]